MPLIKVQPASSRWPERRRKITEGLDGRRDRLVEYHEAESGVTSAVLATVFAELREQRVQFEGMLLKPNIMLPVQVRRPAGRPRGRRAHAALPAPSRAGSGARDRLPSGGQSDEDATKA